MVPGKATTKPISSVSPVNNKQAPSPSFLAEARKTLTGRQDSFKKELLRIKKEWTPDSIHDVRVACRRFRSTLRVFAPVLDPSYSQPIDKALKRFMKKFNSLRDCDVHIELLESIRKPSLHRTQQSISTLRTIFQNEKEALDLDLKSSVETSLEFSEFPPPIFLENAFSAYSVPTQMLIPELSEVKKRQAEVSWLKPADSAESLHSLRVQIKRLRYGFEIFQNFLGTRETGALLARLKKIQDLLGWVHDCDTLAFRLRRLLLSKLRESYRESRREIRSSLSPCTTSTRPKTKILGGRFQQAIFYVFRRVSRLRGSHFSEARRIFIQLERMQWHETLNEWLVSGKCPPVWKKLAAV